MSVCLLFNAHTVSEAVQNINIRLVTRALGELRSLKEDLTCLKESVVSLNDSVRSLHEQLTEHKQQTVTTDTITQQMNTKLNTLISDLSQHQQQTAAESAQFQTSFIQLHQHQANNITLKLETIKGYVEQLPVYTCGGTGGWRRVVYLDMTDPSTTCPSGWQLTGYSKRTCGRASHGTFVCDSVSFPVSGGEYNRVCGRIEAYQWGSPDGFVPSQQAPTMDSGYVDGVSVTHGNPHQHIWTFAGGLSEDTSYCPQCACPCDSSSAVPAPAFVGEDYFCESGLHEPWARRQYVLFPNDPLWDGQNCPSSSTCCSLHNPPYFVKQLPSSTAANIEARICLDQQHTDEDIAVELVELYVQ